MKKINKIFVLIQSAIFSMGVLISSIPTCYAAEDITENHASNTIAIEDIPVYQPNGDKAFNVLNHILVEDMEQGGGKYQDFIKNYAGSAIDKNGKLVVYISSGCEQSMPALNMNFSNKFNELNESEVMTFGVNQVNLEEIVKYEWVKYSYDELKSQQKEIWELRKSFLNDSDYSELYCMAEKIVSLSIDPTMNCVSINVNGFEEIDYELSQKIFSNFSYNINDVGASCEPIPETITLKPGQGLSTGGSLGFRCTLNKNKGFVTTIHSNTIGSTVSYNGQNVGKVTHSLFGDYADFSFVNITNNDFVVGQTTNTTPSYSLKTTSYAVSLPIGYTVYLAGAKSSVARTGKVVYFDYTIGNGHEWLVCDYLSYGGDSGGCIFTYLYDGYSIVGIHDGTLSNTPNRYGTKITTIKQYYDIQIY